MARPSQGCPRRDGEAGEDSGGPHDPDADDKDPVAGAPVYVRPQNTTLARDGPCAWRTAFPGRGRADLAIHSFGYTHHDMLDVPFADEFYHSRGGALVCQNSFHRVRQQL